MGTDPGRPELRVVETAALRSHERADASRASALAERLSQDGCLRNPILTLPIEEEGLWLVLDGANRAEALRSLGLPHALVQVVRQASGGLWLSTWNRVVYESDPEALRQRLAGVAELRPSDPAEDDPSASMRVAFPDGTTWAVGGASMALEDRLRLLHQVLEVGVAAGKLERTEAQEITGLEKVFPGLAGLLRFQPFRIEEVMEAGVRGLMFPAGITRFIASPRALRVNYPLEHLRADRPTEQKQAELEAWLAAKVRTRQVRYYPESTYLFDE